jgi:signal transduction histidine kinase
VRLRGRLLLGATALVLIPLLVLAVGIRREMGARLIAEDQRRVDALTAVIAERLRGTDREIASRLDGLRNAMREDNDLRAYLAGDSSRRAYVLDWATRAMTFTGLDLLQLQDADGRILSSGHFRNEYDRLRAQPPIAGRGVGSPVLVGARRPEGTFRALVRADSLRLGGHLLFVTAGREINDDYLRALSPGEDLRVTLVTEDDVPVSSADELVRALAVTYRPEGDREATTDAHFVVTHPLGGRYALLARLDRWLAAAWGSAAVGSLLLAAWFSRGISRPIEQLAARTREVDLDRLDTRFPTDRSDEIGTLSRFLGEMTARLRAGAARLQEAERRSTLGELARQVNHDLRNAFTPLRNVVGHLTQVARDHPAELPRVYEERRETLEAGLGYLDELATQWRRVASTRSERSACALDRIVTQVTAGRTTADGGPVVVNTAAALPAVHADPVGLRRIVENLVANACESVEISGGRVHVTLGRDGDHHVRLEVRDDGPGIPPEIVDQIFDDFFTTKKRGSGLGLSVVRRLVSDYEGTIQVESRPGEGAVFRVTLPASSPVESRRNPS